VGDVDPHCDGLGARNADGGAIEMAAIGTEFRSMGRWHLQA
jgi:hypothetical protein